MSAREDAFEILESPVKSRHDKKQHRVFRLTNGMTIALVHDDKVRDGENCNLWPSCALAIAVGSLSDPIDSRGLAQYLGRMIANGENEFVDFVKGDNLPRSRIDGDSSIFSFSSKIGSFDKALELFATALNESLNMRQCMTQIRDDLKWTFDAHHPQKFVSSLSNASHPARNFPFISTNLDCTDDDTLYKRIAELKNRHYSAHRMGVCMHTSLSLDEMQELAVKHFSAVRSNRLPGVDFTPFTHENAFQPKFRENVYFVKLKPRNDDINITFTWCVPATTPTSSTSPYEFLRHIIAKINVEGSLNSYMRQRKLVDTVHVVIHPNSVFTLFTIIITFPDEGVTNLDEIVESVFSFIRLYLPNLKRGGLLEKLYRDFVNVENWPQHINDVPLYCAEEMAKKLLMTSPRSESVGECEAINDAIDSLTKANPNIMVTVPPTYDESLQFELKERSCDVEYSERKMPDKWMSFWNDPTAINELSLPATNPYIADDFTILYDGSQPVPKYPSKVYESDVSELWFRQDDVFLYPIACCYFYFKTPSALSSIENAAMNALFCSILNRSRVARSGDTHQAHIEIYFKEADNGIILRLRGPNQSMPLVIHDITTYFVNFAENFSEEDLRKNIHHDLGVWSYYAVDLRKTICRSGHALCHDKFRVTSSIRLPDMREFCRQYFRQMKISALIQGNLSEAAAQSIMQLVETNLNCGKIQDLASVELFALKLPIGTSHLLLRPFEQSQSSTDTINHYQIGADSHRTRAMLELLKEISRGPLSAKEQFGVCQYSWQSSNDCGVLGYNIYGSCAEETHPAPFGCSCIDEFHSDLASLIANMPADEFQKRVSAAIESELPNHSSLVLEVEFQHWPEIESGDYCFDRHERVAEILPKITQSELLQFHRDHSGTNERKLSIQCVGYTKETGLTEWKTGDARRYPESAIYLNAEALDPASVVKEICEFKKSLESFK